MSIQRIGLIAAAAVTLAILGFYASRLAMPQPIFAGDEATYLIRAMYAPAQVARYPAVAAVSNGLDFSVIRALYYLGAPLVVGDRMVNAAAYLAGLLLVWQASVRGLPRRDQATMALIALAFPYYRFAFSDLAEGLFVGVLALFCLATGRWMRSRPMVHAAVAGAIGAALVLVKPTGIAEVGALATVMILDTAVLDPRDATAWRRLPLRLALFATAFFTVGNLIQWAAEEHSASAWTFFVGAFYGAALGQARASEGWAMAAFGLAAMVSSVALLAGAPLTIGLAEVWSGWRAQSGRFKPDGRQLVFLMLALSMAATLAMTALFVREVTGDPHEIQHLFGRYFEFLIPLLWLAAAPPLVRPLGGRLAFACAGVMLAGLAGLLACFRAGETVFPWDAASLLAFFHPDPVRANLGTSIPYQALAAAAGVAAAAIVALRRRVAAAGLGLFLALGVLSTYLDHSWLGPLVAERAALDRDLHEIHAALPPQGDILLLAKEVNEAHLVFLGLEARPWVEFGPSGPAAAYALATSAAVVVTGPETPPGGPWRRTVKGERLSLFRRADSAGSTAP
ncbi:hypothetical protein [Phenylobacterium sp.]|uniref:hypothetical protein n=1 Tax=Phenylobacterium sp. TaxID=1871053 RepID=UPI0011FA5EA6|nr:hypothetical protein [Phenylobacterium sp.]THD65030.1 MAG: hypothetical protein E8A49_00525 [Phenylobacterium sp.]